MTENISPVEAWSEVLDYLDVAGHEISQRVSGDPAAEAEGCRFLSRLFASMRLFLLEQDPQHPDFVPVMTPTRKFFADNPDTLYHRSPVREDLVYRVTGNVGRCTYLSFCVYAVGEKGTRIVSDLPDGELKTNADGDFEIVLSAEEPKVSASNWMKLEPGVRSLVTRQYYLDRARETPARYEIACVGSRGSAPTAPPAGQQFRMLRDTLERAVKATLRAGDAWSAKPNTISFASDAQGVADLFPTPDNQYTGGWFRLDPEEALVLTIEPPDCRYWNVHLLTRWLESLDGRRACVSFNKSQTVLQKDGTARFIIAARDPGLPNWLDTGGRAEGCFAFRWLQAETTPPTPRCERVLLRELSE